MLGITFKENCPDIRNTRAIDVYEELKSYNVNVDVYDPWADKEAVQSIYGIDLKSKIQAKYEAVILAVSHKEFLNLPFKKIVSDEGIIYDVKGFLPENVVTARL